MKRLRKTIAAIAIAGSSFFVATAVEVPVVQAAVTNCSKGTSGRYGWSYCSGRTNYAPYTTRHVIVVTCDKWDWLPNGGDAYDASGNWASVGQQSNVSCASYYNARSPRILFA